MKIHSDILTERDLFDALAAAKAAGKVPDGVRLRTFEAGSRQRRRAWDCRLEWLGVKAFYTEHGWWLAEVFRADPWAVCGPYKGELKFHEMTSREFTHGGAAPHVQEQQHVTVPPGAARFVPEQAEAELRFKLTGEPNDP
jgi:hypothetical protein